MDIEIVIGLEIHAQLNTQSKLFCGCQNDTFGAEPNTHVCPICMGFPGALPALNERAVEKALFAALAFDSDISLESWFDRKNYFYPDLPAGYQISQFDRPIAQGGEVSFFSQGAVRKIRLDRVQIENDAGKLFHTEAGTLCDFNRAGAPLIEIVTKPDLRSPEEAALLAKELQKILRFVNASDADMEKGMMRFDASISVRGKGSDLLHPRTEIKNLNSFSSLQKALVLEAERQYREFLSGILQKKEVTMGWQEDSGTLRVLRDKEGSHDYRYFREPDIPALSFLPEEIQQFQKNLPELPLQKFFRYQQEFSLSEAEALKLSESAFLSSFFEETVRISSDAKKSANLILTILLSRNDWDCGRITPQHVADVISFLKNDRVSSAGAREILLAILNSGKPASELLQSLGLEQVFDDSALSQWVDLAIAQNPNSVEDYRAGKEKALQFLMGQVMKISQGAANPSKILDILKKKL